VVCFSEENKIEMSPDGLHGRVEDRRFLVGKATYTDDLQTPGAAFLGIVRSTYAHARIDRVDFERARKHPSFVAVLSGKELHDLHVNPLMEFPMEGTRMTKRYPLATEKVTFVGEPLAAIVSKRKYDVEDIIELVDVEYTPLPPVITTDESESNKTLLYEEWGTNLAFENKFTRKSQTSIDAGKATAVKEKVGIRRQAGVPIETRSIIASYDKEKDRYLVYANVQGSHGRLKNYLSAELGIPPEKLHGIVKDIGGAFGTKGAQSYSERVLACVLAKKTGLTIRWSATRTEDILDSAHGRDEYCDIELSCDSEGRILCLKAEIKGDLGVGGTLKRMPALSASLLPGPYRVPNFEIAARGFVTNKSPSGPVRGAGRPEGCYFTELAVDALARSADIDPIDFRLKNVLTPEEFPYDNGAGLVYDSANYPELLRLLKEKSEYSRLKKWKEEVNRGYGSEKTSSVVAGIGVCVEIEDTGAQLSETARIVADGNGVTVFTGSLPQGQGHETTMAVLCARELGLRVEQVRVEWGDTDYLRTSVGTFGSRSAAVGGSAVVDASRRLKKDILAKASALTGIDENNLSMVDGQLIRVGQAKSLMEFVDLIRRVGPQEAASEFKLSSLTFASGAHLCALLLDVETGRVRIEKYVVVDDCGRIIDEQIVEGQIHGGVAHGLGGSILEEIVYDDEGQPLTTNFLDYTIPTSFDIPPIEIGHVETPSTISLDGAKGVGESGTIAAYPAFFNALNDALFEAGCPGRLSVAPASPQDVWAALKRRNNESTSR
jgi:carbon-monoxide dehydrogenase large subunit